LIGRLISDDLLAVEAEARLGGGLGGVTGGDGAVERAGVGGGANHDELLPVELRGQRLGLFLGLEVAGLELAFLVLEGRCWPRWRAAPCLLRQKVVAGVAVLDLDDLAHLAELGHAFEKDDFHGRPPYFTL
jgi:hypothetical protein